MVNPLRERQFRNSRKGFAGLLALAGSASAITITLTSGSPTATDTSTGIILSLATFQTAGTGVIDPFLRLQNTPAESGFNSSGPPQGDAKNGPFTHDLLFSTLQQRLVGSTLYYQFSVDINQTQNNPPNTITLDRFDLYTGNNANITSLAGLTLRVSLGDDYVVPTQNAGSGAGDLFIYVPISYFPANPGTYLTLNASFSDAN
ncbi:MAG: hypothetical protein ABIV39_11515, partial [Verrucomicrobiota bacterium]